MYGWNIIRAFNDTARTENSAGCVNNSAEFASAILR